MTLEDLIVAVEEAIASGRCSVIGNHNLHSISLYHRDGAMRSFCDSARYVFIDGMPIVFLGRMLGLPLRSAHRLTAVDWLPPLLKRAAGQGWRVFFLGARPGVAGRAADRLRSDVPGLQLEVHHGYFDQREGSPGNEGVLTRLGEYRPHLLIVGLGMPRQEDWIRRNRDRITVPVILNQGGFLDYFAGATRTPPRWLGPLGLEWLGRLACDPRRLAARYLVEPWSLLPHLSGTLVRRIRGEELRVPRQGEW